MVGQMHTALASLAANHCHKNFGNEEVKNSHFILIIHQQKKREKKPRTKETSQQSKASDLNQNTLPIVYAKQISFLYVKHATLDI